MPKDGRLPFMEEPSCAESSATPAARKRNPSSSRACVGWSIAATTAPAWRPSPARGCTSAKRPAAFPTSFAICATSPPPAASASATRAGPRTAPPTTATPTPTSAATASIAVVHNGVIENYTTLKRQLAADGVAFHSDTDTEVVAQLIAHHLRPYSGPHGGPLAPRAQATRGASRPPWPTSTTSSTPCARRWSPLKGTYGLAVVCRLFPDVVIGARLGSPLVLGIGDEENFLASDPGALVGNADASSTSRTTSSAC